MRQESNETSKHLGKNLIVMVYEISAHINPVPDYEEVQSHRHGKYERRSISDYNYIFPVMC